MLVGHGVNVDLAADLPLVNIDAVLVDWVFANLLENAGKYTPAGTRIQIAARVAGPDLLVVVEDDGPGLPPGREEVLFQKFTRGESESSTAGVGLGLAICRAIVEAHGGRIGALNRTGPDGRVTGARFWFTLPVDTPPAVPAVPDDDLDVPGASSPSEPLPDHE